jgi:hypothetical protein
LTAHFPIKSASKSWERPLKRAFLALSLLQTLFIRVPGPIFGQEGEEDPRILLGAGYGRVFPRADLKSLVREGYTIDLQAAYLTDSGRVPWPWVPDHYGYAPARHGTGSLHTFHWTVFRVPMPVVELALGANLYRLKLHSPEHNILNYRETFFRPTVTYGARVPVALKGAWTAELGYLVHQSLVATRSALSPSRFERIGIQYRQLEALLTYRW